MLMTTTLSDKALHGGDFFIDQAATRLGFVARHVLVNRVRGQFDEFWGKAHLDLEHPANSWVKVDIEAASITTDNRRRTSIFEVGTF
jgi:polyisoprenoid-binding protein YceI